ncbi:MAG: hypothetical protein U9R15_09185 [Chloroflexota bacterium]|nr:hypothetical protein [Chloroflexota bacterium]
MDYHRSPSSQAAAAFITSPLQRITPPNTVGNCRTNNGLPMLEQRKTLCSRRRLVIPHAYATIRQARPTIFAVHRPRTPRN